MTKGQRVIALLLVVIATLLTANLFSVNAPLAQAQEGEPWRPKPPTGHGKAVALAYIVEPATNDRPYVSPTSYEFARLWEDGTIDLTLERFEFNSSAVRRLFGCAM